jgi:hypothetical protein
MLWSLRVKTSALASSPSRLGAVYHAVYHVIIMYQSTCINEIQSTAKHCSNVGSGAGINFSLPYDPHYMKSSLPKSSSASSYALVSSLLTNFRKSVACVLDTMTYLLLTLAAPRAGFIAALGFFLPLALSRCSFCFSLARVDRDDAALRISTSRRDSASARTY